MPSLTYAHPAAVDQVQCELDAHVTSDAHEQSDHVSNTVMLLSMKLQTDVEYWLFMYMYISGRHILYLSIIESLQHAKQFFFVVVS